MLVHADEFAMYEHGSFRPRMTGDVCERLLRNPGNFEVKCFGVKAGARPRYLHAISECSWGRVRDAKRVGERGVGRLEARVADQHAPRVLEEDATGE